ncbi:MAG: hypothetical protein J5626_03080 [Lachnospiraceae bacterium]|nr:hypothetical protein [Lachnospiraceae bacterium]
MDVSSVSSAVTSVKTDTTYKTENVKAESTKTEAAAAAKTAEVGATYEKGTETGKGLYSINKMSKEDRDALVTQLKADAEKRQSQLFDLVQKTISGQVGAYSKATGDDIWGILSSGKFTVDSATKAQAQEDISEDGYWGVKQTSQRLFDFASALAGDDVDKMKSMQEAMEKGYQQATKTWGKELPDISQRTMEAANKLFEDYFASKAEG